MNNLKKVNKGLGDFIHIKVNVAPQTVMRQGMELTEEKFHEYFASRKTIQAWRTFKHHQRAEWRLALFFRESRADNEQTRLQVAAIKNEAFHWSQQLHYSGGGSG